MYAVYSLLILIFGAVVSPYLVYQALRYKKYVGSLRQRMGYLPVSHAAVGTQVYAEVRGKFLPVSVSALPFVTPTYKR